MCTIRVLGPRLHPATGECFATTNGPRSRSLLPWWRSPHWNIWICRLLFTPRLNPRPLELQDAPAVCTSRSVAMEAVVGVRDEPSESPWIEKIRLESGCGFVRNTRLYFVSAADKLQLCSWCVFSSTFFLVTLKFSTWWKRVKTSLRANLSSWVNSTEPAKGKVFCVCVCSDFFIF